MKKLALGLIAALMLSSGMVQAANTSISNLPSGGPLANGDIIPATRGYVSPSNPGVTYAMTTALANSAFTDATNASNIISGTLSTARFNNGISASNTTFLRGDGTWAIPAVAGVLPYTGGGTGLSTLGAAGQCLTVNSSGTALQYYSCILAGGTAQDTRETLGLRPIAINISGGTTGLVFSGGPLIVYANPLDYPGLTLVPTGSLASGFNDAFMIGSSTAATIQDVASGINPNALNASVQGVPTYYSNYATFNAGNYLKTNVLETVNYTMLAVVRVRNAGGNASVTFGDTYALDASQNAGSTKVGVHATIAQTSSTSLAGTIRSRVTYANSSSSPSINYIEPALSVSDISQWRLIAVVVKAPAFAGDGGSAQVLDLTNATASTALAFGSAAYRITNTTSPFIIGQDYSNFANGQIDVAAWSYYSRPLSSPELTAYRAMIQPYFAARGIPL